MRVEGSAPHLSRRCGLRNKPGESAKLRRTPARMDSPAQAVAFRPQVLPAFGLLKEQDGQRSELLERSRSTTPGFLRLSLEAAPQTTHRRVGPTVFLRPMPSEAVCEASTASASRKRRALDAPLKGLISLVVITRGAAGL